MNIQSRHFLLFMSLFLTACVTTQETTNSTDYAPIQSQWQQGELGIIAVAEVSVEHPLAKKLYPTASFRDMLTRSLEIHPAVKVIDWSRLSAVLFRRNLEWSDVVENPDERKEIQDVLLNDYF